MHKYTDLVMKFSAMVGNELVLEREKKKIIHKMVVKTFILLKDPIIHEIACKQWAIATICFYFQFLV